MTDGYFPRGTSVLRRVHSERAVGLLFGQRALMIGALDVLSYAGTSIHSAAKWTPFQRLTHTGKMFEHVFFGTREEADRALAFVRRLHERVRGELPEAIGPFPAGTPYSALDPKLMLNGVVGPVADSAQVLYEHFVRRLDDDEREALWQDYLLFGELFGMPRDAAPATYRAFRAYWDEHMASDEIFLSDEARVAGFHTGFRIPVPWHAQPGMEVNEFLLLGSLPARVRELYGLSWGRAQEVAFQATALAVRRSRPVVPRAVRRGSCVPFFDVVARTERKRLRDGRPSWVPPPGVSVTMPPPPRGLKVDPPPGMTIAKG